MPASPIDWPQVERFVGFVWRLCWHRNGSVTGGCRTSKRNALKRISGHKRSKHLFRWGWGCACDVVFDTVEDCEAAKKDIKDAGFYYAQKKWYGKRRLHIQGFAVGERPPTMEA